MKAALLGLFETAADGSHRMKRRSDKTSDVEDSHP